MKKKRPGDPHIIVLQREINRLRVTRGSGLELLLNRFPDTRHLLETLAALDDLASPLKGQPVAVVGRASGGGDGIVAVGDHILTPGYASSTSRDRGRLTIALTKIRACADQLDRLLDPNEVSTDTRPRCRARDCPSPNVRQPVGIRYCGFCGRAMGLMAEPA